MRQSSASCFPRRLSTLSSSKVSSSMAPMCVEQALDMRTVQCVSTGDILKRMKGLKLKKLKRKMGLASRWTGSTTLPQAPLYFHDVCGENTRIMQDGKVVRRTQSFCKGIAFSNRPVKVNERVCIRLLEVSSNWSGVLRFGLISINPDRLRNNLPKYVCPDLTSSPGCWAKALSERHGKQGSILYFSVNSSGDVIYGIDQVEIGVFLSGVDIRNPLWVVVDVYGNSTSLQFVDPSVLMNNRNAFHQRSNSGGQIRVSNGAMSNRNTPAQPTTPYPSSSEPDEVVAIPGFGNLTISDPTVMRAIEYESSSNALPLVVHENVLFNPMSFHSTRGANITFTDHNRTIAQRNINEYSKGYVFTGRPLAMNEKMVIQVLSNEVHYVGAMAFGVTSANPANLTASDLPEDCDELLDRSEYWVVCKDVAASPKAGDELSFSYCSNGQITFAKNNGSPHVIMHVDSSLQLYAFFDVFGHTAKVRVLGTVRVPDATRSMEQQHRDLHRRLQAAAAEPNNSSTVRQPTSRQPQPAAQPQPQSRQMRPPPQPQPAISSTTISTRPTNNSNSPSRPSNFYSPDSSSSSNSNNSSACNNSPANSTYPNHPIITSNNSNNFTSNNTIISINSSSSAHNNSMTSESSECSVCYEKQIDSVLYSCGHMCMCYQCALQQWRGRGGGMCPICRAPIKDVIRTYKA